jgi:hypothetical protein
MRRQVFFCITMIALAGCTAGQQRGTSRPSPTFVLPMMVPTTVSCYAVLAITGDLHRPLC